MIPSRSQKLREILTTLFWFLSPSILAAIIVIPRLESAQFGLLDDGNTLLAVRQMGEGSWPLWDLQGRRSRPVYWIYWYLMSNIAGQDPIWFYIIQTLFLLLLVAAIVRLFLLLTSNHTVAWLGGILFVLSGPVIENFYTLSKGESITLFLLVISMIVGFGYRPEESSSKKSLRILAITGLIFMAEAAKETSLVILPISAGWLLPNIRKRTISEFIRSKQVAYFSASMMATLFFLLMRSAMVGSNLIGTGYSDQYEFSIARVFSSGSRWGVWILHDFAYFLPLVIFLLLQVVRKERISSGRILFMSLIWMGGWVSIYLFWIFVADYYLLPFAAAVALCSAIVVFDMIERWRASPKRGLITPILMIGFIGLLLTTLPNNLTMAKQQLKVDSANARLLVYLAQELESGQTVRMNIPAESEYIEQLSLLIDELYGLNIQITGVDSESSGANDQMPPDLIVYAEIENQVLLSPRLGIYERVQDEINQGMDLTQALDQEPLNTIEESYSISAIDLPRIFCPLIEMITRSGKAESSIALNSIEVYCTAAPLVDRNTFTYSWTIYR